MQSRFLFFFFFLNAITFTPLPPPSLITEPPPSLLPSSCCYQQKRSGLAAAGAPAVSVGRLWLLSRGSLIALQTAPSPPTHSVPPTFPTPPPPHISHSPTISISFASNYRPTPVTPGKALLHLSKWPRLSRMIRKKKK